MSARVDLVSAFRGLKEERDGDSGAGVEPAGTRPRRSRVEADHGQDLAVAVGRKLLRAGPGVGVPASRRPGLVSGAARAKSCDPAFEQMKVYVRSATKRRAWRKWEDQGGGDLSDLVEQLLQKYLGT
jgi:hypothetical protein